MPCWYLSAVAFRNLLSFFQDQLLGRVGRLVTLVQLGHLSLVLGFQLGQQCVLGWLDLVHWDLVEHAFGSGNQGSSLLPNAQWAVLWLLQQFGQTLTTVDALLGVGIEVGA